MSLTLTTAHAQACAVAAATDLGTNCTIELRTGAPPGANNAATGSLLATINVVGAFTAVAGVLSAADPASAMPVLAGTVGHFRVKTSGGTTKIEGTVSDMAGSGDMKLTTVNLLTTVPVDIGVPSFVLPIA